MNAANEVAVHAFLGGRLRFLDIAAVIEETLARLPSEPVHSFDSLAEADGDARRIAGELVRRARRGVSALTEVSSRPATLDTGCPTSLPSSGSSR